MYGTYIGTPLNKVSGPDSKPAGLPERFPPTYSRLERKENGSAPDTKGKLGGHSTLLLRMHSDGQMWYRSMIEDEDV
ncbi:predicted protein [Plenodomus lingam JN3]|uniref:Predicted protein n=2 Tax=Leptosphaeria maculans TaxID=5022 RepID=E4ZHJ2_LEPMJ|nr:predicted protein [Plenodomus lingam JN3]CBX90825.1 predicted protein [Plenodomus lingam JN3]